MGISNSSSMLDIVLLGMIMLLRMIITQIDHQQALDMSLHQMHPTEVVVLGTMCRMIHKDLDK